MTSRHGIIILFLLLFSICLPVAFNDEDIDGIDFNTVFSKIIYDYQISLKFHYISYFDEQLTDSNNVWNVIDINVHVYHNSLEPHIEFNPYMGNMTVFVNGIFLKNEENRNISYQVQNQYDYFSTNLEIINKNDIIINFDILITFDLDVLKEPVKFDTYISFLSTSYARYFILLCMATVFIVFGPEIFRSTFFTNENEIDKFQVLILRHALTTSLNLFLMTDTLLWHENNQRDYLYLGKNLNYFIIGFIIIVIYFFLFPYMVDIRWHHYPKNGIDTIQNSSVLIRSSDLWIISRKSSIYLAIFTLFSRKNFHQNISYMYFIIVFLFYLFHHIMYFRASWRISNEYENKLKELEIFS